MNAHGDALDSGEVSDRPSPIAKVVALATSGSVTTYQASDKVVRSHSWLPIARISGLTRWTARQGERFTIF